MISYMRENILYENLKKKVNSHRIPSCVSSSLPAILIQMHIYYRNIQTRLSGYLPALGSRKKVFFLSGPATKAFPPPPPSILVATFLGGKFF